MLLLDLDVQPTLSLLLMGGPARAGGIYELLANRRDLGQLVSRTIIAGLDLVLSSDHRGRLNTLLPCAGWPAARHLLPALAPSTTWC